MSTLATADLASDSDNDGDYIAPSEKTTKRRPGRTTRNVKVKSTTEGEVAGESSAEETDSGSDTGTSDDDEDEDVGGESGRKAKRIKVDHNAKEAEAEEERRRKKAVEAFAAFASEPPVASSGTAVLGADGKREGQEQGRKMVDVERKRKFAGEIIVETVSLPTDHPEVIAYLAGRSKTTKNNDAPSADQPIGGTSDSKQLDQGSSSTAPTIMPAPTPAATASTAASTTKPAKTPIRRKPRQSLEQLSAGLTSGKKMTTLEKSQMDWKKHVSSSAQVADELDSNRRSGGYLEKKDFLDRVGDRRNDTYEKNGSRR